MSDRLMSAADVIDLIGCGRSTFYKWVKAGNFPKGIKINGLRKWWESIVHAYINEAAEPSLRPPSSPRQKVKKKRLEKHTKLKEHSK